MDEKQAIAGRLREEILNRYESIKALADEIGRTQQYINIYLSGITAPGPKVRKLLEKAGLDVPYIMTGRRDARQPDETEFRQIRALMKEKGIRNAGELRQRLDREEALARLLGPEIYPAVVEAAVLREKRIRYRSRKSSVKRKS